MKTTAGLACVIMFAASAVHADEYHVSVNGSDSNTGKKSAPLRTIQRAAELAQPGDVITVHEGIYRERVNPPRGGTSDWKRIVYQAAKGEKIVIKGSEQVKGWEKVENDTWNVTLPNPFFGAFNPYSDLIRGDWFKSKDRNHHTGAVYLNGQWLAEAGAKADVLKPAGGTPLWFAESSEQTTTIWAQFKDVDPNKETVEINVRQSVFYPDRPGRNYITVRGFTLEQAATPWSPPTAEQIGLIGTHWSKGWIIENNEIRYSICCGVTLGKYGDEWDNKSADTSEGYVKTIERATKNGWSRENIGHHIVRSNHIHHCEQGGVVGSLGGVFSTITGNEIHDIHVRRLFSGCEMAGIKIHGAIDTLISKNHIYRCNRGIWLDWMAQGTRITGNLVHDIASDKVDWPRDWNANTPGGENDMFLEVNHGPILVDNNIFLSPYSINDRSRGVAFTHNLFAGAFRIVPHDDRETPYHKPHSAEVVALRDYTCGDHRFYNNIFLGHGDLSGFDAAKSPVAMGGNVYLKGAKPSKHEDRPLVREQSDMVLRLVQEPDGWHMVIKSEWLDGKRPLVTTELLGKAIIPDALFEHPDGTPYLLDRDYFGKKRDKKNPFPGPFENPGDGTISLKVW